MAEFVNENHNNKNDQFKEYINKDLNNGEITNVIKQSEEVNRAMEALNKIQELLCCGDKRIELSAAKEILGQLGMPGELGGENEITKLEVEIKVI